jgi:hypothetical protein
MGAIVPTVNLLDYAVIDMKRSPIHLYADGVGMILAIILKQGSV